MKRLFQWRLIYVILVCLLLAGCSSTKIGTRYPYTPTSIIDNVTGQQIKVIHE